MQLAELMQPRYKVIGDYPNSIHKVGTIYTVGRSGDVLYCDQNGPRMSHYPHLFKPLLWWEDRKPEDMPQYVSYVSLTLQDQYGDDETKTRVYRSVESWHKRVSGTWTMDGNKFTTLCSSHLPATEFEYLSYIERKKGNYPGKNNAIQP